MENPSSQPQYFNFNNTPPEAPKRWFQRPEILKRIGIIAGTVVFVGGGAIFAKNLVSSMDAGPKSELEATRAEVIQRQEDCKKDDEACKVQAQTKVARASGIVAACEGLEGDMRENCVTLIAQEKKGSSACEALSGEAQSVCQDAVILARVVDGEGIALCENVSSASQKNSCKAAVTANARATGDCEKYGVSEDVCAAQEVINELVRTANLPGCATFAEEERIECTEMFTVFDGDGDGLSVGQEIELGTLDTNADSDGDGYPDGQEVLAGYNPLK